MAKTAKLIYTSLILIVFWIVLLVIFRGFHESMPAYPGWLDFVLAGVMLITAILLALVMVLTKRVNLGASLAISTIVLLSVVVAVGTKGSGILAWLRDGLALATALVLLFQYFRARRNRENKDASSSQ